MKKILLLALVISSFTISNALGQDLPDFSTIQMEIDKDYNSTADDAALKAAKYILSRTPDINNEKHTEANQYLIKWMTGTPHYQFGIDASVAKVLTGKPQLLICYMAALVIYQMENKPTDIMSEDEKIYAYSRTIEYVLDKKNNISPDEELKPLIEAYQKGKLKKYLNKLEKEINSEALEESATSSD